MFNNQRYLTKGINESIQLDIQIAIWDCIDKMEIAKDYLHLLYINKRNLNISKNGYWRYLLKNLLSI
ncbi:MAG: DUF960 family protein [Fusobacteriaceae bacterium]